MENEPAHKKLVGHKNFVRHNPKTDLWKNKRFHHVEFYCGDATSVSRRFALGLGMTLVAKSDLSTGNATYASYVYRSNDIVFTFTAPYSTKLEKSHSQPPFPHFDQQYAYDFFQKHGLAVRAMGVKVADAAEAYKKAVEHGGKGVLEPLTMTDEHGTAVVSEIELFGDVVLRFVSDDGYKGPFLPKYEPVNGRPLCYGLQRLDHAVSNVPKLLEAVDYLATATGFHKFAEFTAEDVGTVDSGLNSMVLASNNEMVILPVNEPTFGTPRKSQIQTYLEHNEGSGLQHLALKTDDIFSTLRQMKAQSDWGFEFMDSPGKGYYERLPARIGDILTPEQYKEVEELAILVDKDDQGTLLQIFTKPLGDRPTIFIEIIQRLGCNITKKKKVEEEGKLVEKEVVMQKGGCGGFGKGNFAELFKSIEDYERTLDKALGPSSSSSSS
ncbi:4-hydroxyphenylpyruvate dioxygenase [Balamuthia mandrillaris]